MDQRVIGTVCISQEGNKYTEIVGYTLCVTSLMVNSNNKGRVWQPEPPAGYWSRKNETNCEWNRKIGLCWVKNPGANPYQSLEGLREYWGDPERTNIRWKAPNGIYWICGEKTYSELPPRWKGSCTLGMIRPVFLLFLE